MLAWIQLDKWTRTFSQLNKLNEVINTLIYKAQIYSGENDECSVLVTRNNEIIMIKLLIKTNECSMIYKNMNIV